MAGLLIVKLQGEANWSYNQYIIITGHWDTIERIKWADRTCGLLADATLGEMRPAAW
jgi:hypothetical protein